MTEPAPVGTLPTPARPGYYESAIISVLMIIINCIRIPELLFTPRFWAEEGTTYFSSAYRNGFLENLFSAHYGYFTLYNNIICSLAALIEPENAPFVTIYAALAIQVGVSLYISFSDTPLLPAPWQRYVVALFVPLVSYGEVWLTTIGIQYWLAIAAFFVLISVRPSRPGFLLAEGALLLTAGLTGVVAAMLSPFFLIKSYRQKCRTTATYGALLTTCGLIHLAVYLQAYFAASSEISDRFTGNNALTVIIKWVVFQCSIPFFGRGIFEYDAFARFGSRVNQLLPASAGGSFFASDLLVIPFLTGLMILLLLFLLTYLNRAVLEVQLSFLAFAALTIISTLLSLKMSGGPRYTFTPGVIAFALLVGSLSAVNGKAAVKSICIFITAAAITINSYEFIRSTHMAFDPKYPDWRIQVRLWRTLGPDYRLQIWPVPWTMSLESKDAQRGTQ